MKDRKLATRYARALLSLLPDDSSSQGADQFLHALREAMEGSPAARDLLLDPAVSRSARKTMLRELAERSGAPPVVASFLFTLVDNNRIGSLPSIAAVFHEEREARAGIVPAELVTAAPIGRELQERSRQALERLTGRRVRLTCSVEPELLGGAKARIGSVIYDGSLKTQLERLRNRLAWG